MTYLVLSVFAAALFVLNMQGQLSSLYERSSGTHGVAGNLVLAGAINAECCKHAVSAAKPISDGNHQPNTHYRRGVGVAFNIGRSERAASPPVLDYCLLPGKYDNARRANLPSLYLGKHFLLGEIWIERFATIDSSGVEEIGCGGSPLIANFYPGKEPQVLHVLNTGDKLYFSKIYNLEIHPRSVIEAGDVISFARSSNSILSN